MLLEKLFLQDFANIFVPNVIFKPGFSTSNKSLDEEATLS
jgi:hypothetical protein